jgi:hypothetical protein
MRSQKDKHEIQHQKENRGGKSKELLRCYQLSHATYTPLTRLLLGRREGENRELALCYHL